MDQMRAEQCAAAKRQAEQQMNGGLEAAKKKAEEAKSEMAKYESGQLPAGGGCGDCPAKPVGNITSAAQTGSFDDKAKKPAASKQQQRAHELRDDLEAEIKMNLKKTPAELGKLIQKRFNSYNELKGSAQEMKAIESAIAEMVVVANIVTEKKITLNDSPEFQAAAATVQSRILKVLSK